jgi:hypothetical protein
VHPVALATSCHDILSVGTLVVSPGHIVEFVGKVLLFWHVLTKQLFPLAWEKALQYASHLVSEQLADVL